MTGRAYLRTDKHQTMHAFLLWALERYRERALCEPTVALVSVEDYAEVHRALTTRGEAYDLPVSVEGVQIEVSAYRRRGEVVVGRKEG